MHAAKNNNNPEILITLLKAGADPNIRSKGKMTAYQYAIGTSELFYGQRIETNAANPALQGTPALAELKQATK